MNRSRFQVKKLGMAAMALTMLALLFAGVARPAQAQTYTPLYDFGAGDNYEVNSFPMGQLALGRDGNFYGTVANPNGHSGIYQMTPEGSGTVFWADTSPSQTQCLTGLTLGSDGLFYGTCEFWGGTGWTTGGSGIVFKYDPSQGQSGFTVLYSWPSCWSGDYNDSVYPGPLTLGTDGNFYGVTTSTNGGSCTGPTNGSVFKVTPTGTLTTLHVFQGYSSKDGETPSGPLTLAANGNFYGTTQLGGNIGQNGGTVFQVTSKGKVKVLYSFVNTYEPLAGVIQGADGKFYGTTSENGTYSYGTIFQLTAAGKIAYLHSFNYAVDDVAYPFNPLALGTDGSLYGPSNCFDWGCGAESLYKITTKGVYTDLYNGFTNPDGACPDNSVTGCALSSPMALHPNGIFYGTTQQGGDNGQPIGHGVFYSFNTGLKPYIILQFPRGTIGTAIGIFGQDFTGASGVSFNGVAATNFTVESDYYLTATIPTGTTTGYVTVSTPSGTLKSSVKLTVVK
jgi:uncharacterized repeat protein (TIGR03803 family)